MTKRLQNGDILTQFDVARLGGGRLRLPNDLVGRYSVVLIYRGHWCPFCNEQIAAFAAAAEELSGAGISVVAFSVDDEAATAAFVAKHNVPFPMGYSADLDGIVAATGAYENTHPARGRFLENTGFVLAPDGSIGNVVYSSRAIGRLVPSDVIRLVSFLRSVPKSITVET